MNHKCFDGFIIMLIILGLAAIGITITKQNMDESPAVMTPIEALERQPNPTTLPTTTATSTPTTPAITIKPSQKTLRVGQSFTYDGTKVTFVDVVGDSRCPLNANCIWAGEFSVRLTLEKDNNLELLTSKDTATSSSSLYDVGIIEVKPNKILEQTITGKDYIVTFMIGPKK